ncbi:MAG: homoserine dehydrogenase [Oscillospiraceae bacterium]|nr:homoserine dehydrogenase [Oscillospiraceae bacterium]
MKIALLGFGNVGSMVYRLLEGHEKIEVGILLSRRPRPEVTCRITADFDEILRDESIDTVVEVMGGIEPAFSYVCAAMRAGKNVVTANKQLMVERYGALLALAKECGVALRCTAAAGGGNPWLPLLAQASKIDELRSVEGILNGTTNLILTEMTQSGTDYAAALAQAQQLGYAEADPTADVEGYDARRKLVLSANLAFGVSLPEEQVSCFGISTVKQRDIEAITKLGYVLKLYTYAERAGEKVAAFVMPTLFAPDAMEAQVPKTSSGVLSLIARRYGRQTLFAHGPGGYPTASAVVWDCVDILGGARGYYTAAAQPCGVDNGIVASRFYWRRGEEYRVTEEMSVAAALEEAAAQRAAGEDVFLARIY